MNVHLPARLALGVSLLTAGLVATPAPVHAAAPGVDTATLAAVTEQDPATGRNVKYPVKPGEVVPASLGVTNLGDAPVKGLVVQVRAVDDLDLVTTYGNCWYAVDSNLDIAWCEFDDELAAHATLAPSGDLIVTKADARADKVVVVVYRWFSKAWADERGGVQKLAQSDADLGSTAVRGTGAALPLTARELPLPSEPRPTNFVYATLVTPPTTTASPSASTSPSTTASPSASASPSATGSPSASTSPSGVPTSTAPAGTPGGSPAAPGAGGGDGGGLPVTGSNTVGAVAAGVALLLLGGVGYLVARRRRTRFVA
ncbi:LPXTG cell wall anchor domain-containing protein [Micromonospora sp. R77]|uniref:LPXTG cell wall anchor domain-containing protein n=1 Tax=Micromonospora sp. R77 TaxID=2925836 RepID=UPI001F604443|nr:LPXTG cell wall anchor domain-containing protein [Micromonospora sp. R77]MCI4064615.1 LPXTG cell wall anchor domain-containing protein [Micromonospora sp. R77]